MKLLPFILILILCSCKKQKLEGDSEVLLGKWNWVYSDYVYSICNPPSSKTIITPLSEGATYSIEFQNPKHVVFTSTGVSESRKRTITTFDLSPYNEPNFPFSYSIGVKGETPDGITGGVGPDTLMITTGFPFEESVCENYTSYFVRE